MFGRVLSINRIFYDPGELSDLFVFVLPAYLSKF